MSRVVKVIGKLSLFVRVALLCSIVLNISGLAFGLFYEGFFFDNLAHFLSWFVLVSLMAELAYLYGALPVVSHRRAFVIGASVGLVGGVAWEVIEILVDLLPVYIYNPPLDWVSDILFGALGGAVGAWRTNAYLSGRR
ncbi:hypothetical protein [Rubrobacter indicoceani]|uniref:hypothetical protein n=1 Tax=Rubrobacter indicoceani TaxID=2051957 RepID=UPI000E5B2014|nr:hypothetical protein [Rubrobacter indicoceani]